MKIYSVITVCYVTAAYLLLSPSPGRTASDETLVRSQILMGNVPVSLILDFAQEKKEAALTATSQAFQLARDIEREVSEYWIGSETWRLNQEAGKSAVAIGQHLSHLLQRSREMSELTEGLFDITFASRDPSISYRDIHLDPHRQQARLIKKEAQIGLSGIAKGYIVDRMAKSLQDHGFKRFLINAGGDILVKSPKGYPSWPLARFNHPEQNDASLTHFSLSNGAVATSGTYERGEHIINPRTSRPVQNPFVAVTVISSDAETADALATAAYAAGDRIHTLIEKMTQIYPETTIILTQGDSKQ